MFSVQGPLALHQSTVQPIVIHNIVVHLQIKKCEPYHARGSLRCVPFESQLQVLDLSHNAIEDVDTKELPVTLIMLNLLGNPCCLHGGLRKILTSALMDLMVRPILSYTCND